MLRAIYTEGVLLGRFLETKVAKLLYWYIDPKLKLLRLRGYDGQIEQVLRWNEPDEGGLYALFVYYEPDGAVSDSVRRAVTSMRKADWNVVLLCNHPLSEEQQAFFSETCYVAVLRGNQGFDFGAYQDGVRWMDAEGIAPERVLLLNDSVFFASHGLDEMFVRLKGPEDAIATHENQSAEEHHHLQSFAVSVSAAVWKAAAFRRFWQEYRPINNRMHAIEAGEKRLSAAIRASARSLTVIYGLGRLAEEMANYTASLEEVSVRLPMPMRMPLLEAMKKDGRKAGASDIVTTIASTSPAHSGIWYLARFLNAPLFKKDLYYRQRFSLWELELMVPKLMHSDEAAEYLSMIRRRGAPHGMQRAARMRYNVGVG